MHIISVPAWLGRQYVENAGDAMLWVSNKVAQRADRKMGATAVVRRSHFLVGGG